MSPASMAAQASASATSETTAASSSSPSCSAHEIQKEKAMSWSVRWSLVESEIPAEIERRRKIFPEDPLSLIQQEARYEQSRHFDTRPPADLLVHSLKRRGVASEITLIRFSPKGDIIKYDRWQAPPPQPPCRAIADRPRRITPQRASVNPITPNPKPLPPETSTTMKSNITPESEFGSSSPLASCVLQSCVSERFAFRTYQKDDLARAAMHDGAIIGWDPGLGKTMAIYALPFLKNSALTLIVAPAGLHEQIMDEGRDKFGIQVTPIPDQDTALRLMREGILPLPGSQDPNSSLLSSVSQSSVSSAEPRFFITSYTWLGYNGGDEWAGSTEANELIRARRLTILRRCAEFPDGALAHAMATAEWKPTDPIDDWAALSLPKNSSEARIRIALRTAAMLFHPKVHGGDSGFYWRWQRIHTAATRLLNLTEHAAELTVQSFATDPSVIATAEALQAIEQGIGHEKVISDQSPVISEEADGPCESTSSTDHRSLITDHSIKCVFRPTLASLICGIFDCVICDEAVRLKSGTAYQAQGVLRMVARSRYALTGTPIKNKLPDLFFLASWVTGHTSRAIARWPYGNSLQDRGQFSRDFGVIECNLTKEEEAAIAGKKAPPPKTTNQICNVHRLWRILGPVVIRRRKDDVPDTQIVHKTIVPIRVMPGTRQNKVYRFHLHNAPEKRSILASIGAQLQNLRQAALNPSSFKLTHGGKEGRSLSPWTPKYTAILKLAADLLAKGEQLVIFSPFQDFSTSVAARLRDAGVPHLVLDGNLTPSKRGTLIKRFKSREIPVLIAGIDSMGEGYSLDNARHLVLPSLSWAFDSNTQAVERVHRLTSKLDVTIYVMVTLGTIDERLCSIWQEKGDSSDLALDGRLITTDREEIDLGTLLRDAVKDFDPKAATLDEDEVARHWNTDLLPTLTAAGKAYAASHSTRQAKPHTPKPTTPILPSPISQSPIPNLPSPPRTLFDLMKNKRPTTTPPASTPLITDRSAPGTPAQPANIIPFPGRLAAARPAPATAAAARPPVRIQSSIAAILRK
jgi:hypothetical protein